MGRFTGTSTRARPDPLKAPGVEQVTNRAEPSSGLITRSLSSDDMPNSAVNLVPGAIASRHRPRGKNRRAVQGTTRSSRLEVERSANTAPTPGAVATQQGPRRLKSAPSSSTIPVGSSVQAAEPISMVSRSPTTLSESQNEQRIVPGAVASRAAMSRKTKQRGSVRASRLALDSPQRGGTAKAGDTAKAGALPPEKKEATSNKSVSISSHQSIVPPLPHSVRESNRLNRSRAAQEAANQEDDEAFIRKVLQERHRSAGAMQAREEEEEKEEVEAIEEDECRISHPKSEGSSSQFWDDEAEENNEYKDLEAQPEESNDHVVVEDHFEQKSAAFENASVRPAEDAPLLEATLVTDEMLEQHSPSRRSGLNKWIPEQAHQSCFCLGMAFLIMLFVFGIILVGILCGSGMCSSSSGDKSTTSSLVTMAPTSKPPPNSGNIFYQTTTLVVVAGQQVPTSNTSLDLSNQNMTGTIPIAQIITMTSLTVLNLNGNALTGGIPSEIATLETLEELYLSNNNLQGTVPLDIMTGNPMLKSLDLSKNKLGGPLPFPLLPPTPQSNQRGLTITDDVSHLEELRLNGNQFTGTIPSQAALLTKLTALALHDNPNVIGTVPESLCWLPHLQELTVDQEKVECCCCDTTSPGKVVPDLCSAVNASAVPSPAPSVALSMAPPSLTPSGIEVSSVAPTSDPNTTQNPSITSSAAPTTPAVLTVFYDFEGSWNEFPNTGDHQDDLTVQGSYATFSEDAPPNARGSTLSYEFNQNELGDSLVSTQDFSPDLTNVDQYTIMFWLKASNENQQMEDTRLATVRYDANNQRTPELNWQIEGFGDQSDLGPDLRIQGHPVGDFFAPGAVGSLSSVASPEWHHITFVVSNAGGPNGQAYMETYVDGSSVGISTNQASTGSELLRNQNGRLILGGHNEPRRSATGKMDDFALFSGIVDPSNIALIAAGELSPVDWLVSPQPTTLPTPLPTVIECNCCDDNSDCGGTNPTATLNPRPTEKPCPCWPGGLETTPALVDSLGDSDCIPSSEFNDNGAGTENVDECRVTCSDGTWVVATIERNGAATFPTCNFFTSGRFTEMSVFRELEDREAWLGCEWDVAETGRASGFNIFGGVTSVAPDSKPEPTSEPLALAVAPVLEECGGLPSFTLQALGDFSSPQFEGYQWLLQHPDFDSMECGRLLQLFALATFYHATKPSGLDALKWLRYNVNECDWGSPWHSGAQCENGEYTALGTYDTGLEGSLPAELSLLTQLKLLYLEGNRMRSSMPTELGLLTALQGLNLARNFFTGAIPTELAQLTKLEYMWLDGNSLTGQLPTGLGSLTAMTTMLITDNSLFEGSIPTELGKVTLLNRLSLLGNGLQGSLPSQLGLLTSLTRLTLRNNDMGDSIPTEYGQLTQLDTLWLHSNRLTGKIPSELGLLTMITDFYLSDNNLSGSLPQELANLSQLEHFALYRNTGLTGNIPSELCSLTTWEPEGLEVTCSSVECPCGDGICLCA